jgi:hypothetical protein
MISEIVRSAWLYGGAAGGRACAFDFLLHRENRPVPGQRRKSL